MPTPHPSRAGRLAAEFTVIVVGVLVALVLESWWSEREERRFEADLRADIVEEFRENLQILLADSVDNARAIPGWRQMSQTDTTLLLSMPSAEVTALFAGPGGGWAVFDPASGTVQSLVASGGLWAIEDAEIRSVLARWAGLMDRYTRYADEALQTTLHLYRPIELESSADGEWTAAERRKAAGAVRNVVFWLGLQQETEALLLAEARSILQALE